MSLGHTINPQDVEHVAKLAKLTLSDQQKQQFTQQLSDVLGYVEKLNELNLENVEPLTQICERTNALREDVESNGLPAEVALATAPQKDGSYFQVPKVLGEGSA